MLRNSLVSSSTSTLDCAKKLKKKIVLFKSHKRLCILIATFVIIQCAVVVAGSTTLLLCMYSPEGITTDIGKLVRIMYLFDPYACKHQLGKTSFSSVLLSNFTMDPEVLPIVCNPPKATVSTLLSTKTRRYIETSIGFHVIWFIVAFPLYIAECIHSHSLRVFKNYLTIFFYTSLTIIFFDTSMGIVYITHIQQSLTNGMVLRYSGWSTEMKLENYEHFAGWLAIVASICWMKGVAIMVLNIYCCKKILIIKKSTKKREVHKKLMSEGNLPIPEPKEMRSIEENVLYFRTGEINPLYKKKENIDTN